MKTTVAILASLLVFAACARLPATTETTARSLGPGEHWLPLAVTEANGTSYLCTPDNRIGSPPYVLQGAESDARLTWAQYLGQRYEIGWPAGYTARFSNSLQVLDENGQVVAGAGSEYSKMCPTADSTVFYLDLGSLMRENAPNP